MLCEKGGLMHLEKASVHVSPGMLTWVKIFCLWLTHYYTMPCFDALTHSHIMTPFDAPGKQAF